jgi:hypothetical protein
MKHGCIPLASNARGDKADNIQLAKDFRSLLLTVSSLLIGNLEGKPLEFDYQYKNIFSDPFRIQYLKPKKVKDVLLRHTYWYRGLKKPVREKLYTLLAKGNNPMLKVKEMCNVVDGIVAGTILGFPEVILEWNGTGLDQIYNYTDKIHRCLFSQMIYNYDKVVKDMKRMKKYLMKCCFEKIEIDLNKQFIRDYPFLIPVCKRMNALVEGNSREKMFRFRMFCQTRASGLAGTGMIKEFHEKYVEMVQKVVPFQPTKKLLESIDEVIDQLIDGNKYNFRTSISTSACLENSKVKDGKFGYLREIAKEADLCLDEMYSDDSSGGEIGTALFNAALDMIRNEDPTIKKVNVTYLRGPAKVRGVTAGSFYIDCFLQPLSHLTIELAKKLPELSDSFQVGRLGWNHIEKVDNLDAVRGEVIFSKVTRLLSFDFKEATDHPPRLAAEAVVGRLLNRIKYPYTAETLEAWLGDKDVYYNGVKVATAVNGIEMGKPLTKTNLSLVHPICVRYADKMSIKRVIHVTVGNGDDGSSLLGADELEDILEWTQNFLKAASMLGYEISEEDTFLTEDWGVYCEEIIRIPLSRFHITRTSCRLKDNNLCPYLDHPKLVTVIDVQKDRRDFSSDPKGKVTLLANDRDYVLNDKRKNVYQLFVVAGAIQDVCLNLRRQKIPIYLPKQIFGIGRIIWEPIPWANAICSQNQFCISVTYRVIREKIGELPAVLTLLKGVLKGRHFEQESFIEVMTIPEDDPVKTFVVIPGDKRKLFPVGVIQKLVGEKELISEREVAKAYLFRKRMQELEPNQPEVDLFEICRKAEIEYERPSKDELIRVCTRFVELYRQSPYTLNEEYVDDIYDPSVVKWLSERDPLRVKIDWDFIKEFKKEKTYDTPYRRNVRNLMEWFTDNCHKILMGESYDSPPVEILEDDPIIIRNIGLDKSDNNYVIVTNDAKLYRQCENMFVNRAFAMINMRNWLLLDADEASVIRTLKEVWRNKPDWTLVVDQGSYEAELMKLDVEEIIVPEFSEDIDRRKVRENPKESVYLPPNNITVENFTKLVMISKVSRRRLGHLHARSVSPEI